MKVLVTGGAGFIGSHVVDAYLAAGHEVVAVDNLSTGTPKNVAEGARLVLMDIGAAEFETLLRLERPEVVNHHAAQISVTASTRDPAMDARVNALGLLNVLGACIRTSVKKFIFVSTGGAIYGETQERPTPEGFPPQPLSPYGIHKLLGEHYLRFFSQQHGLQYTVLRYANVYGPRQNPLGEAGVVAIFIHQLLQGQAPKIYAYPEAGQEDGMTRDYVYVEDVARASVLALERGAGETVNIGTGLETTTGALYREVAACFPDPPQPEWADARPGDLRFSSLDVRKAQGVLGWKAAVSLHEGIEKTVAYFA
ncbi:MAG: NAD-dependent epimerase/dehydratase family protein [Spirochaetales bacterium]|nr:NAD-dependent epimerase/dehydratase family protein [Spirochaetales bacterium]